MKIMLPSITDDDILLHVSGTAARRRERRRMKQKNGFLYACAEMKHLFERVCPRAFTYK
jgi:hypothetical protein